MQSKARLLTIALWLTLTIIACDLANRVTTTRIKDVLDHPRDFENKEVTLYGTVTGGASLLVTKYFELQDDSGSIKGHGQGLAEKRRKASRHRPDGIYRIGFGAPDRDTRKKAASGLRE